jgi:SAM-dependent methyltransferase
MEDASLDLNNDRIDVLSTPAPKPIPLARRLLRVLSSPRRIYGAIIARTGPSRMDWQALARDHGAYSVIDARHAPEEYDYVTRRQREILLPLLKQQLDGHERTILDFGCGPGRFTANLAELIGGAAVGFDVTRRLIELAPAHPQVRYMQSPEFNPGVQSEFDVVWVCLVLGGILDRDLRLIAPRLTRVLHENGLLFLAEATAPEHRSGAWNIRTRDELRALFPSIRLEHVASYYDAGQEVSVMAGRKTPRDGSDPIRA